MSPTYYAIPAGHSANAHREIIKKANTVGDLLRRKSVGLGYRLSDTLECLMVFFGQGLMMGLVRRARRKIRKKTRNLEVVSSVPVA